MGVIRPELFKRPREAQLGISGRLGLRLAGRPDRVAPEKGWLGSRLRAGSVSARWAKNGPHAHGLPLSPLPPLLSLSNPGISVLLPLASGPRANRRQERDTDATSHSRRVVAARGVSTRSCAHGKAVPNSHGALARSKATKARPLTSALGGTRDVTHKCAVAAWLLCPWHGHGAAAKGAG